MRKIGILIKKEIMEILRDKKTLIIMVLVPLIMYPLLIIGMTLGMSLIMQIGGGAGTYCWILFGG